MCRASCKKVKTVGVGKDCGRKVKTVGKVKTVVVGKDREKVGEAGLQEKKERSEGGPKNNRTNRPG